jgi:hypothetical protein
MSGTDEKSGVLEVSKRVGGLCVNEDDDCCASGRCLSAGQEKELIAKIVEERVSKLPAPAQEAVKVLDAVNTERKALYKRFLEERRELEARFEALYQPLYAKVSKMMRILRLFDSECRATHGFWVCIAAC